MFKANGRTSSLHDSTYALMLPKHILSQPFVEIKGRYKDVRLDINDPVPVNYFGDVEFFPEGGHCLNGMKNNIAFKAVTRDGYPLDVTGEIIDREGKKNQTIRSDHAGMGLFSVKLSNMDSLYMQILEPEAFKGQRFYLPRARDEGWQLYARNKNQKIRVNITGKNIPKDTLLVTLMIRSMLFYYDVIIPEEDLSLTIPTENLPAGIGVITLFNHLMIPQAERLVFIQVPEYFSASLATDKDSYGTRDSVKLQIRLPETSYTRRKEAGHSVLLTTNYV